MRVDVALCVGSHRLIFRHRAGDHRILIIPDDDIERTSHRLITIIGNGVGDGGGTDGIVVVDCLVGDVRDSRIVVGRGEGRHWQLNCCVVLTIVRVFRHVVRTFHNVQGVRLRDGHGSVGILTAVGIRDRYRVGSCSKVLCRLAGLSITPQIFEFSGTIRHGNRGATCALTMTSHMGGVLCRDGSHWQGRHRHVDGRGGEVITAVFHRHHHIGGSCDHRIRLRDLGDNEMVGRGDTVVGRFPAHIGGEVRDSELTLCLVNVGRFRGNHIGSNRWTSQILYIVYIRPILGSAVTGSELVGVGHLAFAGVDSLDFLTEILDIRDGAVTAVFHPGEAGVQNHRVGCQVECQRGGCRDTLYISLTGLRNVPGAGVDRDHTGIGRGGTTDSIRTRVFHEVIIGSCTGVVIKVNHKRAGVICGMGVRGHHRFRGLIRTNTSLPSSSVCCQIIGERGRNLEWRIAGFLGHGGRNRHGNARIHIDLHLYSICIRIADTDAVSRSDVIGSDGRTWAAGIKRSGDNQTRVIVCRPPRYTGTYRRSSPCVIGRDIPIWYAFCGCYLKFIARTYRDSVRIKDGPHIQNIIQLDICRSIRCTTF